MKRHSLFLSVIFCAVTITAQSFVATFPYTLNTHGKAMVQVEINGHTGNFLFDTGAPTCVTHAFALKTGIKGEHTMTFEDSNGQDSKATIAETPEIKLGNTSFVKVMTMIFEEGNMIENFGVDGIIGYTLFGSQVVHFDGKNRKISIASSADKFDLKDAAVTPMIRNESYLPLFNVRLANGITEQVMFDAGAADFFEIAGTTAQRLQRQKGIALLDTGYGASSIGSGGMESHSTKYRMKIDTLKIGAAPFTNVTTISTPGSLSRIGSALLHYGTVCIDYRTQQFYFKPFTTQPPNLYTKEWDVVITVAGNKLAAGIVWSKLARQITAGDQITAVNGNRFDTVDAKQAITTNLMQLTDTKARITVKNAKTGKERTFTMRQW